MRLYLHFQRAPRWCSKIQVLWMTRTWHISESPTCLRSVLSLTSPCFHCSLHFLLPVWSASHPALQHPPLSQLQCYLLRVASSRYQVQVYTAHHTAGQPTQGWGVRPRGWCQCPETWGTGGPVSQRTVLLGFNAVFFHRAKNGGW